MTATPIVIAGAGGFGREVLDIIDAINENGSPRSSARSFEFLGFLDDGTPDLRLLHRRGAVLLGPIAFAETLDMATRYVIGIADPVARQSIGLRLSVAGLTPAVLVHPSATLGSGVELSKGAIVCSHVSITTNVCAGEHLQLHVNATVGHDVRIEDSVTVLPSASISGAVVLQEGATVGAGAVVLQGLTIGSYAFVGAGAVVVTDVEPRSVVTGVPARPRT